MGKLVRYCRLLWRAEAMCTGTLAGYNAVRYAAGKELLVLPNQTAIGDIIDFSNKRFLEDKDRKTRFTFAGSIYFNRMKERGLYTVDKIEIENRIKKLGLKGIFEKEV